jgi:predicted unusual protein kinase regulating ubiquinone biosynthesis (AarF/ABC1/UbiB family)
MITLYNINKTNIYEFLKNMFFVLSLSFTFLYEYLLFLVFDDIYVFSLRITEKLVNSNILYVKIFQAIALNYNLIDERINEELMKYTDNAPWDKNEIDFDTLYKLEDTMNISFEYGFEPINSGMISLVFKAKDRKLDKDIIIKMKRNNIEYKIKEGLEKIKFLFNLLSYLPRFKPYKDNINDLIDKNVYLIKNQTNFESEVNNMIKMKENCKNLKYVIIPDVYPNITQKYPNIIMMEFIEGLKINKVDEADYNDFAKQVLKFGIVSILIHGFSHGDLHCGNILFVKDDNNDINNKCKYKIGILDFGIIYEIESKFREKLFGILTEIFTSSAEIIAEKIIDTGLIEPLDIIKNLPKNHYQSISNMIINILNDTIYNSRLKYVDQSQVYYFIKKLEKYIKSNELLKYGIKPSTNFVKTQLALAMAHGVTLTLCKKDFIALFEKVTNELFHTNLLNDMSDN